MAEICYGSIPLAELSLRLDPGRCQHTDYELTQERSKILRSAITAELGGSES